MNMTTIGILGSLRNTIYAASDTVATHASSISQYMEGNKDYLSIFWDHFLSNPEWDALGKLTCFSIIIGFFVALILFVIPIIAKRHPFHFGNKTLKLAFCIVWLFGFVVYDVGMCTGQYISLITNAPMAVLYAFKIFIFESDISEIHEPFHRDWVYSMLFALAHFSAAVISTLFLIRSFGFNIMSKLKMWCISIWPAKPVSETFVFWGFNEQTIRLIDSIQKKYSELSKQEEKEKPSSYRIVLVRTNKRNDETTLERTKFARIFDFLIMPTSELEKLQTLDCLITSANPHSYRLNIDDNKKDIFGSELNLKSLKRLLKRRTRDKIHIFVLSEDEKANLHDVEFLLKDSTIHDFVNETHEKTEFQSAEENNSIGNGKPIPKSSQNERKVTFYCHVRYNSIHRVIEDQRPSDRIQVKVVDSSHINVELLKTNKDLLPINYVDVEADATVSSAFNALVIGFSEVGVDSARFLYEFGAFVKTGSTNNIAKRSEFHLDVVDKNMTDLAGTFVANAPEIKASMPFISGGKIPDALITLHQMDCLSVEFYKELTEKWIQKLNYVVIATDNDELNISVAIRIFRIAVRYRKQMKKFRILVRAHNDDDGYIQRIIWHYNRLWAAYQEAPQDDKINQTKILPDEEINEPIYMFGLDKSTFTYDNIIANELEEKARRYAQKYKEVTNPDKDSADSAWDDLYNEVMQLHGKGTRYSPTYHGLIYLRRSQMQNYANSLHELTKQILKEKALERGNHDKNFDFSKIVRKSKTTEYIWPKDVEVIDDINRIAIVLAQTEHLRWNASHEILGYAYSKTKDEVQFKHNCLCDWEFLTESFRSNDCIVSDMVLEINETNRTNQNQ